MKKINLKGLDMNAYTETLNNGLEVFMIPYDNKKDYEELPEKIKNGMDFVFAKDMDTVLKNALKK